MKDRRILHSAGSARSVSVPLSNGQEQVEVGLPRPFDVYREYSRLYSGILLIHASIPYKVCIIPYVR